MARSALSGVRNKQTKMKLGRVNGESVLLSLNAILENEKRVFLYTVCSIKMY